MSSRPSPPASRMTAPFGLAGLSRTARTFCPRDSISTIGSAHAGGPHRATSRAIKRKRMRSPLIVLFGNHGGYVDLQQHALDGKPVDDEECVGWNRPIAVSFAPAFSDIVVFA